MIVDFPLNDELMTKSHRFLFPSGLYSPSVRYSLYHRTYCADGDGDDGF